MKLSYMIIISYIVMLPIHAQLLKLLILEQSLQTLNQSASTHQLPPLIPDDTTQHLKPKPYNTLNNLLWLPRISSMQKSIIIYNRNHPSDPIALSTLITSIGSHCKKVLNNLQTSSQGIISLLNNRFEFNYTETQKSKIILKKKGEEIHSILRIQDDLINDLITILKMDLVQLRPEINNIAHCFLAITIGSILCSMSEDSHQQFTDAIHTIINALNGITSEQPYELSNVMKYAVTTDTLKQAYDMGYLYYKYTDGLMSKLYIDSPSYRNKIYKTIADLIDPKGTLRQALSTYLAKHNKSIKDYFVAEPDASIDKKLFMFFNNYPISII